MPIIREKITPEEFIALADEGNFGRSTERVIRHFFASKDIFCFPSDRQMRQLGGGAIEPETSKVMLGNKEYVFSYRKLDNILLGDMKSNIVNEHLKHIEILIGSDHGQGACRFPAKFVFNKYNDCPTVEMERWLGEITAHLKLRNGLF